ncbi:hypothetical protein M3Y94_00322200 [Aphelenchoides besseyi]|nr:hypothetical protein M3Y94_00322200 [Aphelenchoides besseyi]
MAQHNPPSSAYTRHVNEAGCKREEWYNWSGTLSYDQMESTLSVQQWIQQTIREDYKNIEKILTCPKGVEEGVWKYEHLRQFCMELNGLAVLLQEECVPETCTNMNATQSWIFLCASHKNPKECPAIEYTMHTLDGASALLNSNRYFPSRVSLKDTSLTKIGSVCRRVYRIFSHAYFEHRKLFDEFEIAHRIIADFLLTKKEIPHRVVVFDYAYQFNTPLLDAYLSSWANAEAPLVSEALSNVSVQRVYNWKLLWQKYRENATLVYDFVVIMDIGSLLQDTIYCRQDGLIVQDKIYKELEHLRHSGASVMLLNFSKPQLIFDPMYSVLGRNWSKLMRPRIYLDRSEQPNGGNKGVFFQLAGDF